MIFNKLNRLCLFHYFRFRCFRSGSPGFGYPGILGFVLLFFITSLNAEVPNKYNEKNDKVVIGTLAQQEALSEQVLPAQVAGEEIANNGVKSRVLYAEQWEIARSGESILLLPVLNQTVNAWLRDKQKKIEIQYPGGEEGEFWVQELTDWLVSLGVPSNRMVIVPGSGADDAIKFALIK